MAEYINRKILVDLVLSKLKFMGDARIMNRNDEKVLSEIDGYEKAINAVHELILDKDLIENVQPVKQWVKLHDKHPDTEGFYLVCDQYGECEVAEYIPDIKSWFTHKIKGEIRYWMPLPEPPKDGEQNE